MSDNEFDDDKKIDPEQLDVEAATQAELFFKWAERYVESEGAMDRAKTRMEAIEARLSLRVRKHPEEYGLDKVTDPSVKQVVLCDDKYKEAKEDYHKKKETCRWMEEARWAMEQRKRMIEILVTLHGQQYFAGPSTPRDLVSAYKENSQRREERANEKQRKVARGRIGGKDD